MRSTLPAPSDEATPARADTNQQADPQEVAATAAQTAAATPTPTVVPSVGATTVADAAPAASFADFISRSQHAAAAASKRPSAAAAAAAAAATAATAAAAPSGPRLPRLSGADAQELWGALGQYSTMAMRPFLTQMRCEGLDGDVLTTTCPAESVGMVEKIVLAPLGELATRILGRRVTAIVRPDVGLKAAMPAGVPNRPIAAPIDEATREHPLVKKAQELLGARIAKVDKRTKP